MDGELFVLYALLLAIVGIMTLVRKAIEKARAGEKGKRINLAAAVQKQLRRYMDPLERRGVRPQPEAVERPAAPEADAPRLRSSPAESAPPALPTDTRTSKTRIREGLRPGLREALVRKSVPPQVIRVAAMRRKIDRDSLRDAILLAELLGPPVSERKDYRLF